MTWAFKQNLDPAKKVVLLALADYADDDNACWPKMQTLAQKSSMSERSVRTRVRQLEEDGLIATEKRERDDGSQTSNRYVLVGMTPRQNLPAPPANSCRPPRQTVAALEPSLEPSLNTLPNPSQEAFEKAWLSWPRKTKKQAANKAWAKAVVEYKKSIVAGSDSPHEGLLDTVTRYGDAYGRTTDEKYVPHLSSWLNGARWTDPMPGQPSTPERKASSASPVIPAGHVPVFDDNTGRIIGSRPAS